MRKLLAQAAVALGLVLGLAAPAAAATTSAPLEHQSWSFSGPFGMYDQAQLQRGFKVYTEVCARCHSIKRLHFLVIMPIVGVIESPSPLTRSITESVPGSGGQPVRVNAPAAPQR